MANDYIKLPDDTANTGKKVQVFGPNSIGGQSVEATAVVFVNSAGVELSTANAIGLPAVGDVAAAATDGGAPVKIGGVYNTTLPTYTNGQRGNAQLDSSGRMLTSQVGLTGTQAVSIATNASQTFSCSGFRSAGVTFTGTWVATVTPTVSMDGTNFSNTLFYNPLTGSFAASLASSVAGNGNWVIVGSGGAQKAGVVVTGYSSGTVAGTLSASSMDANAFPATGNVGSGATDSGNPVKVGGVLNTTAIALTNGQRGDLQQDAAGSVFVNTEGRTATYRLCVTGYAPYNSATDIFAMSGSASKTVRIKRVSVTGVATAASTVDVQVVQRTAANTGGTTSNVLTNAMTLDSSNASTTVATAVTYSVVPSGLGSGANADSYKYTSVATATTPPQVGVSEFGIGGKQPLVLRGSSQFVAINLNGASVGSGGTWDIVVEWTEGVI